MLLAAPGAGSDVERQRAQPLASSGDNRIADRRLVPWMFGQKIEPEVDGIAAGPVGELVDHGLHRMAMWLWPTERPQRNDTGMRR